MKIIALSALIALSSALNLREDGGDYGEWHDPCDLYYPECTVEDPCEEFVDDDTAWDNCINSDKGAQFEADLEACVDTMTEEEWEALLQCFEEHPVSF